MPLMMRPGEETLGFIKGNQNYMRGHDGEFTDGSKFYGKGVYIKGETIEVNEESPSENLDIKYAGDLRKLKLDGEIIVTSPGGIWIDFSGDYVKKTWKDSRTWESRYEPKYQDVLYIIINDDEMRPRLVKAFTHLAYLATEKRKAAREASGEKF